MLNPVGLVGLICLHLPLVARGSLLGIHKELYTTNAICRRKYCVNPIFPGLEDLHRLGEAKWVGASLQKAAPSMSFCKGAINYNPALPAPSGDGASLAALVKKQEQAAITMYTYHLAGMGVEYWDHTRPGEEDDDCIRSVWRMTCYTYFPRADIGCKEGQESKYLKPCQSSCFNYIRACGVECCDESVQCVFEHTKAISSSESVKTQGYANHDGPSSQCTGAGKRSAGMSIWLLFVCLFVNMFWMGDAMMDSIPRPSNSLNVGKTALMGVLVAMTFSLQGCDMDVPSHVVGNWRGETDYLINYEFIPPEASPKDAQLNSCAFERLAQTLQCSGRGICKAWDPDNLANPISFCECDRDWADPECRTPRKSQFSAYLFSLFLGPIGADQFYLGFPVIGGFKLATFGGFGLWWVVDIIRIGSAPVYSSGFRCAADLPHWAFVLMSVTFAFSLGFVLVGCSTLRIRRRKRKDAMLLQAEEESRGVGEIPPSLGGYNSMQKGMQGSMQGMQGMH